MALPTVTGRHLVPRRPQSVRHRLPLQEKVSESLSRDSPYGQSTIKVCAVCDLSVVESGPLGRRSWWLLCLGQPRAGPSLGQGWGWLVLLAVFKDSSDVCLWAGWALWSCGCVWIRGAIMISHYKETLDLPSLDLSINGTRLGALPSSSINAPGHSLININIYSWPHQASHTHTGKL